MATTLLLIGIVIFVAGAAVGGILLVSWGIRREERDFSLTRRPRAWPARAPAR